MHTTTTLTGQGRLTNAGLHSLGVHYRLELVVQCAHLADNCAPPGARPNVTACGSVEVLEGGAALPPGSVWGLTLADGRTHPVRVLPPSVPGRAQNGAEYAISPVRPDGLLA